MTEQSRITVLLADDHSLVRRGFRRLLEDDASILVVGEARDGDEAVELAGRLKPRVVVMDCAMPGMSGPDLHRELVRRKQRIPTVFITAHGSEATRPQLIAQGAVDCLLKPFSDTALRDAIDTALGVR